MTVLFFLPFVWKDMGPVAGWQQGPSEGFRSCIELDRSATSKWQRVAGCHLEVAAGYSAEDCGEDAIPDEAPGDVGIEAHDPDYPTFDLLN